VGGGFLITPALNILGLPMLEAVGTSLLYVAGMALIGLFPQLLSGTLAVIEGLWLGVPAIAGSWMGKVVAEALASQGWDQSVILWCFVGLLAAVLVITLTFSSRQSDMTGSPFLARIDVPPQIAFNGQRFSLAVVVLAGFVIGLLSGLMGVGGGIVVLPLLVYGFGFTPRNAASTSLICVLLSGAIGGLWYYGAGLVNLWNVLVMLMGAVPGTVIGRQAGAILHGQRMMRYFAGLVLLAVVAILTRLAGLGASSGMILYAGLVGMAIFILFKKGRVKKSGYPRGKAGPSSKARSTTAIE
jgi:uncharacterized membrane protein YfcA